MVKSFQGYAESMLEGSMFKRKAKEKRLTLFADDSELKKSKQDSNQDFAPRSPIVKNKNCLIKRAKDKLKGDSFTKIQISKDKNFDSLKTVIVCEHCKKPIKDTKDVSTETDFPAHVHKLKTENGSNFIQYNNNVFNCNNGYNANMNTSNQFISINQEFNKYNNNNPANNVDSFYNKISTQFYESLTMMQNYHKAVENQLALISPDSLKALQAQFKD